MKTKNTLFSRQLVLLLITALKASSALSDCGGCAIADPPGKTFTEVVAPSNGRLALPSPTPSSLGLLPGFDTGKRRLGQAPSFRWLVDEQPVEVCQAMSGTGNVFIGGGCAVWEDTGHKKHCTVVTQHLTNHQTIGNLVLTCLNGVGHD